LKKLEKAEKHELPQAWKEAHGGGHQAKRHFYYKCLFAAPHPKQAQAFSG
jgi:hypothetical protein